MWFDWYNTTESGSSGPDILKAKRKFPIVRINVLQNEGGDKVLLQLFQWFVQVTKHPSFRLWPFSIML